jgi:hypothetical protein
MHLNTIFREKFNQVFINIFSPIITEKYFDQMSCFIFNQCFEKNKEIKKFIFDF